MHSDERRKYNRYDTFLPVSISVPCFIEGKPIKLTCWTKDVSLSGISLEFFISKQAEINFLHDLLNIRSDLDASFSLKDDLVCNEYEIKLTCSTMWGSALKQHNFFVVGLKIERIAVQVEHIWDYLINKLARLNNTPIFPLHKTITAEKAAASHL